MTEMQISSKCLTRISNHTLDHATTRLSPRFLELSNSKVTFSSDLPLPSVFLQSEDHIHLAIQARNQSNLNSSLPHPSSSSNKYRMKSCGLRLLSRICPLLCSHRLRPGPHHISHTQVRNSRCPASMWSPFSRFHMHLSKGLSRPQI